MELLLQVVVVAIAVLASTVFAAWRLTPAKTRYRVLSALNRNPKSAVGRWLAGLKNKAAGELAHGCGACPASSNAKKPSIAGRLGR